MNIYKIYHSCFSNFECSLTSLIYSDIKRYVDRCFLQSGKLLGYVSRLLFAYIILLYLSHCIWLLVICFDVKVPLKYKLQYNFQTVILVTFSNA